jgi:hypothetical protein
MVQQELWKQKVDLFRRRFVSREDIFGEKRTFHSSTSESSIFLPVCVNYGSQQFCQITRKEGGCSDCTHRIYQKLTDEWIWKHISGQKELLIYLINPEGNTIKFGAIDFDTGNPFEDAKLVKDVSVKMGLPCYISRSSKKGYHLYWFFKEKTPAYLFVTLAHYLFRESGLETRYLNDPSRPLPEVFPKQTQVVEETRIGNGIKPPMIEPRMRDGFNCFVNDEAVPYPYEDQWKQLEACEEVTELQLTNLITASGWKIFHTPVSRSAHSLRDKFQNGESSPERSESKSKPYGDFWNIVNNCPALAQFWKKDAGGAWEFDKSANEHGVPHMARVASLSFAVATTNGSDVVQERWNSPRTKKELKYALTSGQHPWTCRKMQEHGLCRIDIHPRHGDRCLKKMPPVEIVDGKWKTNPNQLPESEWAEPSPYRFASGYLTKDQILEQLSEIFPKTETIKDDSGNPLIDDKGNIVTKKTAAPDNFQEQLSGLLKRARKLNPSEQKEIKDFISANKLIPNKELKGIEKRIEQEAKSDEYRKKNSGVRTLRFGKNDFFIRDGRYFVHYLDQKGNHHETELTNFTVEVTEEVVVLTDPEEKTDKKGGGESDCKERYLKGVINIANKDKKPIPFKITTDNWTKGSDTFFSYLVKKAGGDLLYNKSDFDNIRNCINGFSMDSKVIRKQVEDFGHYTIKEGEHTFITPSVIVTKDSIRPNNGEYSLEFTHENCKPLDFKIIDDKQFKELANHIITDYFNCNSSVATMTTFAHAMAAAVLSHLPLSKSPVLWLYGSFSTGKSFVAEIAQNFYGAFDSLTGMSSTGKGKLLVAHTFRDALLVIDDFKAAMEGNSTATNQFIHSAYDRSGRVASTRTGELRAATKVRGLLVATGEDFPDTEASAISRMLIVDVGSKNKNVLHGERCKSWRHEYCGFTPHFIQFVYNTPFDKIRSLYHEYFKLFEKMLSENNYGADSGHRIAENMSFNMTAFRLAMELLFAKGVIPHQRKDELCRMHVKNLEIIRTLICTSVSEQQGASMFLDYMKEMLQDPARYHITDYPTHDPLEFKNSRAIGFFREKTPDVAYIYPKVAHGEGDVMAKKNRKYLQDQRHIAKQLYEGGHIPTGAKDESSASHTKQVLAPDGSRICVWVIKLESLGLQVPMTGRNKPKLSAV